MSLVSSQIIDSYFMQTLASRKSKTLYIQNY